MCSSQKSAINVRPGRSVLSVRPVMMAGCVLLIVRWIIIVMKINTVTFERVVRVPVSRDAGKVLKACICFHSSFF